MLRDDALLSLHVLIFSRRVPHEPSQEVSTFDVLISHAVTMKGSTRRESSHLLRSWSRHGEDTPAKTTASCPAFQLNALYLKSRIVDE